MKEQLSHETDKNKLNELAKLWTRMIACIVHDMRTPLLIVQMAGSTFENVLPDLLSGYQLAVEHKLVPKPLKETYLKAVEENLISANKKTTSEMQAFLDVLYPFCKNLFLDSQTDLSIKDFIETTLEKYPFTDKKEQELVHTDYKKDFRFIPVPSFTEHLLEILLSNAINSISQSGKGKIDITTAVDDKGINVLYFKYNTEMPNKIEEKIFDKFFLKKDNNTLPGLGFCKLALLHNNGDILCKSTEDKVEFIIYFPNVIA